jgi:hypothetical protein
MAINYHVNQAANFDLILGEWGPETGSPDKRAVALAFRQLDTGPSFVVADAADRPMGTSSLVGEALSREQVVGEPIAKVVFAILRRNLLTGQSSVAIARKTGLNRCSSPFVGG